MSFIVLGQGNIMYVRRIITNSKLLPYHWTGTRALYLIACKLSSKISIFPLNILIYCQLPYFTQRDEEYRYPMVIFTRSFVRFMALPFLPCNINSRKTVRILRDITQHSSNFDNPKIVVLRDPYGRYIYTISITLNMTWTKCYGKACELDLDRNPLEDVLSDTL